MKKIRLLIMAVLLLSLVAGCGKTEEVHNSATVDSITVSLSDEDKAETSVENKTETTVEEKTEDKEADETGEAPSATDDLKAPSNSGRLHVDGIQIKNEKNEPVQLKGLSTHGLAWYPSYVNDKLFEEFRYDWNCNVIRLAMYTEEYGGYVSGGNQSDLKKLIDDGVSFATDNDMYVIIDWHILSDGNPNKNKDEAKKFFDEMSALYKDHENVIYEICNEPNGGVEWKDIKAYAEEVIPVIRKNDKEAIILVGTPNWSQYVDKAAKDPIEGYDNIMYTLHFYADTHKNDLRKTMEKALKSGLPIFVSEYGICDASGNGAINVEEAGKWMSLLDEYGISSCAWNISNKGETSAIFICDAAKVNGFKDSDLSPSGKWVYSMLTGKSVYEGSSDSDDGSDGSGDSDSTDDSSDDDSKTVKHEEGNFSVYLKEVNSWESEDGTCHQYELIIVNNGDDVTSWTVELSFDSEVTLKDGWCGKYTTSGSKMTVSNESYNGEIKKGAQTRDIGFIVIF